MGWLSLGGWFLCGIIGMLFYWYDKYYEHKEKGQDFSVSFAFICASGFLILFGFASMIAFIGVHIMEYGNKPFFKVKLRR